MTRFLSAVVHCRPRPDFFKTGDAVLGLHNVFSSMDYEKHAVRLVGGFGSIVIMIFMTAPHFGHVIGGRFLPVGSSLNPDTRKTICRNRMSLLLQGCRKP
jgi:hypothetical protein